MSAPALLVDPAEYERIRALEADPVRRAQLFADAARLDVLGMVQLAGSGHLGTCFSVMDVLAWLHLEVLGDDDICFSSKGHDVPALYAVLVGLGRIDPGRRRWLRRVGGLAGHPDIASTPELATNTGSLGMGISKAKGLLRSRRLTERQGRVFVILGDGELQEGQIWESLGQAANDRLGDMVAIVDRNQLQSDTWVDLVSDLGDLEAKFAAFGWAVGRCDGNEIAAVAAELDRLLGGDPPRPKVLIADTTKGAGARVFEPDDLERSPTALYRFHSGAPSAQDADAARREIVERTDGRRAALGLEPITLVPTEPPPRPAPAVGTEPVRLVAAYGHALAEAAARDPRVVALSGDLVLDTGLVELRTATPGQFVECGIAEQDMVSQAGGLALGGHRPFVHSFASFLTARANEQIFNNATEQTRIVYVGSLAGLVPGGPGHSHQSVRDIALLGSVPGMAVLEPATDDEAAAAVEWALEEAPGPVYLRLVSVPWPLGFDPPAVDRLHPGRGRVVRDDGPAMVVCTGPVLASQAWAAADLAGGAAVVLLPWLRGIDGTWLGEVAGDRPIVVVDNHLVDGGQGAAVRAAVPDRLVHVHGVEGVPACGTNEEVLTHHGLDAASIAERLGELR